MGTCRQYSIIYCALSTMCTLPASSTETSSQPMCSLMTSAAFTSVTSASQLPAPLSSTSWWTSNCRSRQVLFLTLTPLVILRHYSMSQNQSLFRKIRTGNRVGAPLRAPARPIHLRLHKVLAVQMSVTCSLLVEDVAELIHRVKSNAKCRLMSARGGTDRLRSYWWTLITIAKLIYGVLDAYWLSYFFVLRQRRRN